MFKTEDLLKLIESQDPQAVANDFAAALNEAIKIKSEKEAKAKLEQSKFKDAKALEEMIVDYVKKYYPDVAGDIEMFDDADVQIFVGAVDELCNEMKKILPKTSSKNTKTGDPLSEFLRKNGL